MNQALSKEQLAELSVAAPVSLTPMTRNQKLERWATLIEQRRFSCFMFDRLEHMAAANRDRAYHPQSPFSTAHNDPVLKDAGLAGPTVGDAKRFFEISDEQLHGFSCNCGGEIGKDEMANRIRNLKSPDVQSPDLRGVVASVMTAFIIGSIVSLTTIGLLHL